MVNISKNPMGVKKLDLIVVGGGAAGYFAAINAAIANPNLQIMILEKGNRPLAKVRISGGGRCNVTHACFESADLVKFYPRGERELRGAFTRFQPKDMVAWLQERGVLLYTQPDGCMFPVSDQSETIINCFLAEANRLGIGQQFGAGVNQIGSEDGMFKLILSSGEVLFACKVLLAVGGGTQSGYMLAKQLGHTIIPPVPSLFTFEVRDPRLEGLMGVSVPDAVLRLPGEGRDKKKYLETNGPVLITHWGLSGPAVLKLSAWGARFLAEAGYKVEVLVNWLPGETLETYFQKLRQAKEQNPRQHLGLGEPAGRIPRRLWKSMVMFVGLSEELAWGEISRQALYQLAEQMTNGSFRISGKGVFKDEFVTCGGVSLKEVDFKTMQSRLTPGLFFAGEYLDIDGLTGGYNFQAAWTTGWLAAMAIAG